MKAFFYLIFLILFFTKAFGEQRLVKSHKFTKGEYYDTIKYEFDITDTQKIGKLDYDVSSDGAVATLIMNSTEYYEWTTKYYYQWLQQPEYNFDYLNNDMRDFMCKVPVAACTRYDVKYPDRNLYVVIVKDPRKEETNYEFKDDVDKYQNSTTVAKLVYDPLNPPLNETPTTLPISYSSITNIASSIVSNQPTQSSSLNADPDKLNQPNKPNNSTNNGIDKTNDKNKDEKNKKNHWYWYLIGGLALLLVLGSLMFASIMHHNKKKQENINNEVFHDENLIIQNQNSFGNGSDGIENKGTAIPYNPHHSVKRVAYNYKADDITFERDNIIEITKRYNDGWASAVNPKDGNEYLVPLIILEGDLSEDLSNIPYEEKKFEKYISYTRKFI